MSDDDDDVIFIEMVTKSATKRCLNLASLGTAKELADMRNDQGDQKYKDGEFEAAVTYYSDAIDLVKDALYYSNRSQANIRMNKISEGLDDAQMAVKIAPHFPKAHSQVIRCFLLQGKEDIIPTYVETLSPEDKQSKDILQELDFVKSIQKLKNDIERNVVREDWEAVANFCGKLLEDAPSMSSYRLKRAEALVYVGKIQDAIHATEDILRKDFTNAEAIFVRGLILMYQDQLDNAYETFKNALQFLPNHEKSMTYLKKIETIKGNKELAASLVSQNLDKEALEIYFKTLTIEQSANLVNAKLFFNLSVCFAKLGQVMQGLTACNKAISLDSNYLKARMKRVQLLMANNRLEEASKEAAKLSESHQNSPNIHRLYEEARSTLLRSKAKQILKEHSYCTDINNILPRTVAKSEPNNQQHI